MSFSSNDQCAISSNNDLNAFVAHWNTVMEQYLPWSESNVTTSYASYSWLFSMDCKNATLPRHGLREFLQRKADQLFTAGLQAIAIDASKSSIRKYAQLYMAPPIHLHVPDSSTCLAILVGEQPHSKVIPEGHGLVCLDFDDPYASFSFFKSLETEESQALREKLLRSPMERTPSSGLHIYLFAPKEFCFKNGFGEWFPLGVKKDQVEWLGNHNAYSVTCGASESKLLGKTTEGYYEEINPIVAEDGTLLIQRFSKDEVQAIHEALTCALNRPTAVIPSATKKSSNVGDMDGGKAKRCNEIFWNHIEIFIETFGYKVLRKEDNRYLCLHPDTKDFTNQNCVFGANKQGDGLTFWAIASHGNFSAGEVMTFYNFCKRHGWEDAEVFTYAEELQGDPLDPVDESRFDGLQETEDTTTDVSGNIGCVSEDTLKKKIREYQGRVEAAKEAERILRPKTKGSLIAKHGDMFKHNSQSGFEPSVIPYSCAMAYLAHYMAGLAFFEDNPTVIHTVQVAPTSYGKGMAFIVYKLVDKKLCELEDSFDKGCGFEAAMATVEGEEIKEGSSSVSHRKKKLGRFNNWVDARIKPASSQGLEDAIKINPHCMIILNEFGDSISESKGKGEDAARVRSIINSWKELWDCLPTVDCRSLAKDNVKEQIEKPMVNLIAFTVEELFYQNFSPNVIRSGGLNRIQIYLAGPQVMIDGPIDVSEITSLDTSGEGFASIAERVRRVPTVKLSQEEIAEIITKDLFEHLNFYHNLAKERGVKMLKLTASECFKKAEQDFMQRMAQKLTYNAIMGTNDENVIGRKRQIIYRYALLHCMDRMGTELLGIDFEWALGVTELSNKEQQRIVSIADKNENLDGNKEVFERIGKVLKQLQEKGKTITAGVVASNVFTRVSEKDKRNASYFKMNWEQKLKDSKWINVTVDDHYELTPEFFKEVKSWKR